MAYGKSIKKNFYTDGKADIAMPPLDEKPPVLDNAEWSGPQKQQAQPVETPDTIEEAFEEGVEVKSPEESVKYFEENPVEVDEDEESEEIQETPKQKSKNANDNLRILRERAEKAEREREELMKYVLESKKSEQPVKQKVAEPEIEDEDFDFSVDDDALIEGKQAKRLAVELKKVRQEMKRMQSQTSETATEAKIKAQYPDFDAVVNQQTVQQLNAEYPEIAATLRDTKDLYSKATAAYKIMKKFGIYRDTTYDKDKEIALKNTAKPRTVTSLNPQQGDSPLSKANAFANGMSKDLQAQLLKEMAAARKNL